MDILCFMMANISIFPYYSTGQYAYLFIPDFSYEDCLNCDLQNVTNDPVKYYVG